jgi:ABC superfamily ATP binding cassette transporter substrate-binding protein
MATSLPRRRFIQGSALAAALGAAAACSRGDSGGGGATADFSGTGQIAYAQGKDFSAGMVQAHLDEWNEQNPDEQVTLIELSESADQQRQSLINNAQTQSDAYDVISVDVVWVAEFAANQWVLELPIDDLTNDDIIQPVWDAGCYMDRLFAMPYVTDAPIMYYRKDFLAEAGVTEVPTTWDGIKSAVDAVRALPGHESIGGFGGQFAKYEGLTCCAAEFIHTAGGDFFDDQNQVIVNSPESVKGLQNLMDGFKDGYIPGDAREWKEEDSRNAFEDGNLVFQRQWPFQYANNLENLGEDKFGVAALPSIDGKSYVPTLGGHYCGVSAFSKNKATALKFIQWWTAKESQQYRLDKQANAPILGSLYEDAEMIQKYPYLPTLRASLDAAEARPKAVAYGDVTAAIQDAIYPAIQQQTTAEQAITGLEEALKNLQS